MNMKDLFPSPLVSAALFAFWLMLNQSLAPGHLALAALVAIVMPALLAPLRPRTGPVRRPLVLARLILRVGRDVVMSALNVANGIFRAGGRVPRGAFVVIPLDIREPHALASLAVITTVIPGTVWSELAPDRSALLLHVFDLDDEATFIDHYKTSYELPLKEIFE